MREQLLAEVRRRGVITRPDALAVVARHVLDDAVRVGALARVFPGVYALAGTADNCDVRRTAALAHRRRGALSHTDGLDVWALPTILGGTVHLTVPETDPATRVTGITLHRRGGFVAEPPSVVIRRGLRVVRLEQAVVESWPLLPDVDRRVPAIVAIRDRRTTGARLLEVLALNRGVAGAAEQREVFSLAAAGCHSPLEMWGHQRVFSDKRLPMSRCQVPVTLPTGLVYLDRLYDAEMVNVELDGAAYHGEPGQRERDLRRDAALAALGYLTVRFSHLRLHADPDGVITELLAILAMRRAQLGIAA